ncbi:MAG: rhombotarget lipoprotein [Candidatus Thiodiazotropha sp.]
MSVNYRASIGIIVLVLFSLLSACAGQQTRTKSSVVDYLYPKDSKTVIQPSIPTLNIPIKVGIAFVPEQSSRSRGINIWSGIVGGGSLTEADKSELLETVADNFRKYEFVSEIEVIPSAYLTEGGSFQNLDQIKTMYGIDVIALVSYDQVQFTDEGLLSITYWTLVGAYIISGEKNDTSTMLDTAVYDIESRKMLFRAPGTSNVKGRSTPVNLSEELRVDSVNGFKNAAEKMTANLDLQLSKFKEKIKSEPGKVKIVHREGYSGGGAVGFLELFLIVVAFAAFKYKSYIRV